MHSACDGTFRHISARLSALHEPPVLRTAAKFRRAFHSPLARFGFVSHFRRIGCTRLHGVALGCMALHSAAKGTPPRCGISKHARSTMFTRQRATQCYGPDDAAVRGQNRASSFRVCERRPPGGGPRRVRQGLLSDRTMKRMSVVAHLDHAWVTAQGYE